MGTNRGKWCTYGSVPMLDVGRVEQECDGGPYIRYSEGQQYEPEPWDGKYVKRFATPEEALAWASWWNSGMDAVLVQFANRFPSVGISLGAVKALVSKMGS